MPPRIIPISRRNHANNSKHFSAVWYLKVRFQQNNRTILIRHAQRQHFAKEWADLTGWEVYDCAHLAADELIRTVMDGELRG